MAKIVTIPPRGGKGTKLAHGQSVQLINTLGQQVVDCWAFNAQDANEFMSMEHSHTALAKLTAEVGEAYVTNRRRPILTVIEDTSPGVHDTLLAACDAERYAELGCEGLHANCADNLRASLETFGLEPSGIPCPLNLFMNLPVIEGNRLEFRPPLTKPGDSITLRAEMDAVVVFSCCPMDVLPVNGAACIPTEAHFTLIE